MEVQGEMGCRNCFASADAAAMEKIEAVKKSLGIWFRSSSDISE